MSAKQQVVVVDSEIDTDSFMLEGIDTSREPLFTVGEVSKIFFHRTAHWLRWLERRGDFVLDGEVLDFGRTDQGARRYSLTDIEKLGHALVSKGIISPPHLLHILSIVRGMAYIYEYLPRTDA